MFEKLANYFGWYSKEQLDLAVYAAVIEQESALLDPDTMIVVNGMFTDMGDVALNGKKLVVTKQAQYTSIRSLIS